MTPAEASEIDRLEFKAECAAIRQRAYALLRQPSAKACSSQPIAKQRRKPVAKPAPTARRRTTSRNPIGRPAYRYTAYGITLPLSGWADRLNMKVNALHQRISNGWTIEEIINTPAGQRRQPGVVINFDVFSGTGAGSTAQETPEITFSEEANS